MQKYTHEQLVEVAMKIILYAGNGRQLIQEAFNLSYDNASWETVKNKLNDSRKELTKAHKIQTDVIQNTITNAGQKYNILFIHAQDTLMTINSELFIAENVLKLNYLNKK